MIQISTKNECLMEKKINKTNNSQITPPKDHFYFLHSKRKALLESTLKSL